MKKLLALLIPTLSYAAAETDLTKGIDFTGRTNASASLLNQLVDNATLKFGKGGVLYVSGAPDVANNHRYTNFLWLDPSTTPPTLKQWANGSTIPLLNNAANWQSVAGSISSVTEGMLQTDSVTSNKIKDANVISSKIAANAVGTTHLQDASVSTLKLVDASVTRAKLYPSAISSEQITNSAIQTTNIADLAVTSNKLALGAIYSPQLIGSGVIAGTNLANNTVTSNQIQHISVTNIPDSVIVSNKLVNNTIGTNLFNSAVLRRLPVAWATFVVPAGSTNMTLNNAFNVASVTRYRAGNYTFVFSTALATTNYATTATYFTVTDAVRNFIKVTTNLTTSVTVAAQDVSGGAPADLSTGEGMSVIVFGGDL